MEGVMNSAIIISILATGIRSATPYLLAALGEMFTQRSGVYNLGVEGIMMMGAFAGFFAEYGCGKYEGVSVAYQHFAVCLFGPVVDLHNKFIAAKFKRVCLFFHCSLWSKQREKLRFE